MSPSIQRLRVVLMTYLNRRAFQGALLAMVAGVGIAKLMPVLHIYDSSVAGVFFELLIVFLLPCTALVAIVLFFLQARQQLMGTGARLMPESRGAHLIVIGALFLGITVAISSASWQRPLEFSSTGGEVGWTMGVSPAGSFVVVLGYMTLAAIGVCNPWLMPIFVAMLILGVCRSPVYEVISQATVWWRGRRGAPWIREMEDQSALYLRTAIFLADVLAIQILIRLTKPKPARESLLVGTMGRLERLISRVHDSSLALVGPHVPMTGLLSRGRHRRFAVHSHKAPWVLGGGVAVVLAGLLWLVGVHAPANNKASAALFVLTLVPGIVVASGWRERWAGLGYESLFPSARGQFVKEIAVALATDLAEFWIAALVTCAAVLAVFSPRSLVTGPMAISIFASLMMQALWFGTIFLTSRLRQVVPYAVLLIGVAVAMVIPIFRVWQDHKLMGLQSLVLIALAEMACGIIFLLSGLGLWRRADLA